MILRQSICIYITASEKIKIIFYTRWLMNVGWIGNFSKAVPGSLACSASQVQWQAVFFILILVLFVEIVMNFYFYMFLYLKNILLVIAEFQRLTNQNLPNTYYKELDCHPTLDCVIDRRHGRQRKLVDIIKIHDEQVR